MITVKDLMQCETQSSPDGKHWEPVIPDGSLMSWRVRLQDALAVWRGEAIAIRQTTKADIPKDYMERNSARDAARRNREAQPSVPAPWREAVNPPGERGIYLVRIGDQTHVAQFDPRMVSAKWWKAYGLPSRLAQEPTHWMPLPTDPDAAAPEAPAQASAVDERETPSRLQINNWMRDAGWQNSAIRQADLEKVERVVRAALAQKGGAA